MSSSKFKKRSSSEVKESVYMVHIDTDAPGEHLANDPIEIEEEEEESTEGASKGKSKGKQVARNYTQRAECHRVEGEWKKSGR